MTLQEFNDEFDVLYNNITSNQAPGLDEYEKSVFLTKAQDEIVKAYFDPKSNKVMEGFDESRRRLIDFSMIMSTCTITGDIIEEYHTDPEETEMLATVVSNIKNCSTAEQLKEVLDSCSEEVSVYYSNPSIYDPSSGLEPPQSFKIKVLPKDTFTYVNENLISTIKQPARTLYGDLGATYNYDCYQIANNTDSKGSFDMRQETTVIRLPYDILMIINELVKITDWNNKKRILVSVPISYEEYSRLMEKPFKRPPKNQVWRLLSSDDGIKKAELILGPKDNFDAYSIRYIRKPKAIRLRDFTDTGVSIGTTVGYGGTDDGMTEQECELDPILHHEILQRAVELAKSAYLGDLNTMVSLGLASHTPIGMVAQKQ